MKVVIVDDEISAIEDLGIVLRSLGVEVVEFRGGADGNWEAIAGASGGANLVLVDLRMRGNSPMDSDDDERPLTATPRPGTPEYYEGTRLIQALRRAGVQTKCAVITRHDITPETETFLLKSCKVQAILDKRTTPETVVRAIAVMLGAPHLADRI